MQGSGEEDCSTPRDSHNPSAYDAVRGSFLSLPAGVLPARRLLVLPRQLRLGRLSSGLLLQRVTGVVAGILMAASHRNPACLDHQSEQEKVPAPQAAVIAFVDVVAQAGGVYL